MVGTRNRRDSLRFCEGASRAMQKKIVASVCPRGIDRRGFRIQSGPPPYALPLTAKEGPFLTKHHATHCYTPASQIDTERSVSQKHAVTWIS